ncbi:MAG: hypothetical protein NTAFB09_21980 [Nitrosospira sp.]
MMMRTVLLTFIVMSAGTPAVAQVQLNREDAFNNPSRHAWNLFQIVNHPARDPKLGRGLPDLTKKIGEVGTTVVWETWRLSETEVFLEKGVKPPEWDDLSLPGGPTTGKVPEPPKAELLKILTTNPKTRSSRSAIELMRQIKAAQHLFDPNDGVFRGRGGFGESRMNRATFDFIRSNGLYSIEGQQRYTSEFVAGNKLPLSFPVESMEIKAGWIEFSDNDIQSQKDKAFYVAEFKGKKYGLAALHIITKDVPNWFWSTFHHKDAPIPDPQFGHGIGNGDSVGQPASVKGTIWENYRLGGTQTNFIESTGAPTMLSDALIEKGFVPSSCISCHARATATPSSEIFPLESRPVLGAPNPDDFSKSGKPILMQTDFLFSLPIRAKSEK